MNEKEQINHFADELDRLIDRFRAEYELSYAAVVGCLQMKQVMLCNEAERNGQSGAE